MFKLLPVILSLVVLGSAYPEGILVVPQAKLPLLPNDKLAQTAQDRLLSSAQAQSPSSKSVSSEQQQPNESDHSAANEETAALAAAALTRGTSSGSTAAPAAPTEAPRSALLLAALTKSAPGIQHHILPARTIPLPIAISTRPGLHTIIAPETITIQQPTITKVGEVVQHIPTAVSHQRQTIVHKHARIVTPIVAPAVRTITSQLVRAYHTPLIFAPQFVSSINKQASS